MPLFRFAPPPDDEATPWRQVHYEHDFSGGAVCDVTDPFVVRKLRGNRYFQEVSSQQPKRGKRQKEKQSAAKQDANTAATGAQVANELNVLASLALGDDDATDKG